MSSSPTSENRQMDIILSGCDRVTLLRMTALDFCLQNENATDIMLRSACSTPSENSGKGDPPPRALAAVGRVCRV